VLAFAVRVYFFQFHPAVEGDGVHYAALARNILEEELAYGFYAYRASIYKVMVAVVAWITGQDIVLSGQFVSALWGSLLVVPVYLFGYRIGGKWVALLAACLAIIHQALIHFSAMLFTEATYLFFLYSTFYCAWVGLNQKEWRYTTLAGICAAVAVLVKMEGILYLFLLLIFYLLAVVFSSTVPLRRVSAVNAIAFISASLFTLLPVIASTTMITGESPLSSKASVNLILGEDVGDYSPARAAQRMLSLSANAEQFTFAEEAAGFSFIDYVVTHPKELVARVYRNLGNIRSAGVNPKKSQE